jgi:hypothetical protein
MRLTMTGWAEREVNLTTYETAQLSFSYKTVGFDSSGSGTDYAYLKVYVNGNPQPTVTLARPTSYTQYTYTLPPGQIKIRFEAATTSSSEYLYVDNVSILSSGQFYVDDVSVTESDHFYVDDLWIGNRVDIYTLEVAYTDTMLGNVFMDTLSVWLPPGTTYGRVIDSFGLPLVEPTYEVVAFADGTVVQWNFSPTINLALPVGAEGLPIVRSLSFTFSGGEEDQGMFVWMKAHRGGGELCLSWDTGYSLYRTTSQASNEIWGTNTKVEAYVGQGEINKRGLATYGNYVATGNPLLIDYTGSSAVKEKRIDPATPSTWVTKDGFLYDGRSDVTDLPADSEMIAAWLYWSAFMKNSDWSAFGSQPDTTVDFMFPKYHTESFDVSASPYNTLAYPIVDSPQQPQLYLYPLRHCGEELGTAYPYPAGNDTFFTDFKPVLATPAPKVWAGATLLVEGTDYTLNYATGNVTIINDGRSGLISIDYSVSDSQTLVEGVDYTLNRTTGRVTITNSCLAGTVIVNYWAETWQTVQHNAVNEYGGEMLPAETEVPLTGHVGHTYACFYDATQLLKDAGVNGAHPGAGEYAVRNITSTQGVDSTDYATRCFSGWSLVILYKSDSETAHQFYLYDPIHNPDECPFMMIPSTDPPYEDPHIEDFSLKDFYPPAGTVNGRVTYFVGEGDTVYTGDYIQFKGVSRPSYTTLGDPPINPADDVMNTRSTTGERGIDIDTYPILDEVGSDTEANVRLATRGDRWYLIYMILSFKTSVVPKADYAFNVAAITYSYELGTK